MLELMKQISRAGTVGARTAVSPDEVSRESGR